MCILLYVKLMQCSGIPYMYGQLQGGTSALTYMCILLYMKLIWCSGIPQIYGQLEQRALVYVHSAICETYFSVVVFHTSVVNWKGIHLPQVYVHSAICETYLVQWYSIDVWLSVGGYIWPKVYVHSAICETVFGVVVFYTSMVNWRRGTESEWYSTGL